MEMVLGEGGICCLEIGTLVGSCLVGELVSLVFG